MLLLDELAFKGSDELFESVVSSIKAISWFVREEANNVEDELHQKGKKFVALCYPVVVVEGNSSQDETPSFESLNKLIMFSISYSGLETIL
jgi:hypothetical protein